MVDRTTVENVARLARLEFSDEEYDTLIVELNSVIGYIDQLKELDVSTVEPMENMNEGSPEGSSLRHDSVVESLPVESALKNAPRSGDNYFLVPKVLQQEVKAYVERELVGDEEEELDSDF